MFSQRFACCNISSVYIAYYSQCHKWNTQKLILYVKELDLFYCETEWHLKLKTGMVLIIFFYKSTYDNITTPCIGFDFILLG